MITNEMVNQAIDYILKHLDQDISIEDVADHCHFSKYYFSRVFKAETGESIYAFIKRIRMEQSAIRLKLEKEKAITDIGLDYGYSPSNYSSVFKLHHQISPAEFRKSINSTYVTNPFDVEKLARFQSFEEYDKKMRIQELEEMRVLYERHIGNYTDLWKNWCDFTEKYKAYFKEDTLLIERFYDDPLVSSVNQCLYDLCMTVDQECELDHVTTIARGRFVIYTFEGLVEEIFTALQGVFSVWLPGSGFEMNGGYGLDIYRAMDGENRRVVMDLCIPIK